MRALAKLKDDARRHEQREEWQQAIDLYLRVLRSAEEGETELELPLYNRIGDLFVRLGRPTDAVRHYEQAADMYAEAGLYNNAIALCNKALRYMPDRLELFRKLGRFSASQGFLTDARHWFLEYAERMFARGELDSAFAALEDFADLTDDPEVRADFARQLAARGRPESAIEEFRRAYAAHVRAGATDAAERIRGEARELLPDAGDIAENADIEARPAAGSGRDALPGYGEAPAGTLPAMSEQDVEPEEAAATAEAESVGEPLPGYEPPAVEPEVGEQATLEGFERTSIEAEEVDHVEEIEGFDTGRADEETQAEAAPLPLLDDETAADETDTAAQPRVATTTGEETDAGESDATPLPLLDAPIADERHAADDLYGVGTVDASAPPEPEPPLPSFEPEPAGEEAEPGAEPAPAEDVDRHAEPGARTASAVPWEDAPPGAAAEPSADDYVDLFALINPDEDRVFATRFFVEEKQPTGDEDRDFAEMLAEFKAKVAAHVGEQDSGSHYDLGLAFKEMGLIDEAIGEFQVALRAGANRLKVFEELGQCFILKRQPTIAVKILARALQIEHRDELEMIGVYYHLGRAFEELGQANEARDAYERVLGLDIGFKDVMDRVSRL